MDSLELLKAEISKILDSYETKHGNMVILGCILQSGDDWFEWGGESFQSKDPGSLGRAILNSRSIEE